MRPEGRISGGHFPVTKSFDVGEGAGEPRSPGPPPGSLFSCFTGEPQAHARLFRNLPWKNVRFKSSCQNYVPSRQSFGIVFPGLNPENRFF